ncbi:unnamed protein product [Symbiodinium sp. CCMP2592]|nr:unnamed protein product [Symbiodinium sp. CCMP2592]
MIWYDEREVSVLVGAVQAPWPPGDDLDLYDGAVITLVRDPTSYIFRGMARDLFLPTTDWGALQHMPRPSVPAGICVQYNEERFFVQPSHHYGATVLEAVAHRLRLDAAQVTTGFFPTSDLSMQGQDCFGIMAVVDLPHPTLDALQAARRDVFTLIDPRALGVKPHIEHSHFPAHHLPSIAARLDIRVPTVYRVTAVGGRLSGEDIYVQGHSTLILYAVPHHSDSEEEGAAGDGPSPPPRGPDRNRGRSPQVGRRFGGMPARESEGAGQAPLSEAQASGCGSGRRLCAISALPDLWAQLSDEIRQASEGILRSTFLASFQLRTARGPVNPSTPMGLAIASLVFRNETALLPAPFHRLGDVPPGTPGPADPATAIPDDEEEESEPRRVLHATFLLFAPGHAFQTVPFAVELPCNVPQVLDAVARAADADFIGLYPRLLEICPQPFPDFGVLLALPAWSRSEPVVLLDLSAVDGRCFAASLPSPFTRAQALEAARLPYDLPLEVFAFGSPRPLREEEPCEVQEAGSISFHPEGAAWVVRGSSLQIMLWSGREWARVPDLASPPVGNNVCLVCNEASRLFVPPAFPDPDLTHAIADEVGSDRHLLSVSFAEPPLIDVLCSGHLCSHVAAAMPLAATADPDTTFLIVDRRPLLLGWDAFEAPGGLVSCQQLLDWLDVFSPPGWHASVAHLDRREATYVVRPGTVARAIYVPDGLNEESEESSETEVTDEDLPVSTQDDAATPWHTAAAGVPDAANDSRARSRSPLRSLQSGRPTTSCAYADCHALAADGLSIAPRALQILVGASCVTRSHGQGTHALHDPLTFHPEPWIGAAFDPALLLTVLAGLVILVWQWHIAAAWTLGFLHRAFPNGSLAYTTCVDGSQHHATHVCFGRIGAFFPGFLSRSCRLLVEPPVCSMQEQSHFDTLRDLADQMGLPWPFLRSVLVHGYPDESADTALDASAEEPVEMHVAVLVPDFQAERLCIREVLPVEQDRFLELVRRQRDPVQDERFPVLIPAIPQPLPAWALFIAAPVWAPQSPIAIFDMWAVDGRVFALEVPLVAPCWFLLQLANAPPGLDVNVVIGFAAGPVPLDREVRLLQGQCVTFVPAATLPPPVSTLDTMLLSPQLWEEGPAYPSNTQGCCYCVATEGNQQLFVLDPRRPWAFREDIADTCRIPAASCVLAFARPGVLDCAIQGVDCRTAVAAARVAAHNSAECLVLVDCRAILQGWTVWRATDGLLDVTALEQDLGEFAPLFWRLTLTGPRFARGIRPVRHGEVISVIYVPDQEIAVLQDPPALAFDQPQGSLQDAQDEAAADMPSSHDEGPQVERSNTGNPATHRQLASSFSGRHAAASGRHHFSNRKIPLAGAPLSPQLAADTKSTALASALTGLQIAADHWDTCLFAAHAHLSSPQSASLCGVKLAPDLRQPLHDADLQVWPQPRTAHGTGDSHGSSCPAAATAVRPDHPGPPDPGDRPHPRGPPAALQAAANVRQAPARTRHTFVILVPDMAPEIVEVSLAIPVGIQEVIALVTTARGAQYQCDFPHLCPVYPQPDPTYGVFVARPAWAAGVYVVCVDTRAIDDRLFAMPFPAQLNRESLLRLVHLRDVPGLQIFVAGVPFGHGQVHLRHGDTVLIRWGGRLEPPAISLAGMLSSPEGWQHGAVVALGPLDMHVLVLTDGIHHLQTVDSSHRATFKQALVTALQYSAHRTSLKPSSPRITDCCYRGFSCHSVIVATEAICRLPVPPARPRPPQLAILLDKRPVLRGFTWFVCAGEHYDLQDLRRTLQQEAPSGYVVDVRGGHRFLYRGRPRIMARQGQVIQVRFVQADTPPDGSTMRGDDADDSSHDPDDTDSAREEPPSDEEDSSSTPRAPRSRSPPPGAPRGPPPPQPVHRRLCPRFLEAIVVGKCSSGIHQGAFAESGRICTTAPLGLATSRNALAVLLLFALSSLQVAFWQGYAVYSFVGCAMLYTPRACMPRRVLCLLLLLFSQATPAGGMLEQATIAEADEVLTAVPAARLPLPPGSCHPPHPGRPVVSTCPDSHAHRGSSVSVLRAGHDGNRHAVRPVATPCRLRGSGGTGEHLHTGPVELSCSVTVPLSIPQEDDLSWHLCTLLEEAVASPSCEAFFLAATLLETLAEHLASDPPAPAATGRAPPIQLSLADAITPYESAPAMPSPGPPVLRCEYFDLTRGCCQLPIKEELWTDLGRLVPWACLDADLDGLRNPARFAAWCSDGNPGVLPRDTYALCFTSDGSYCPHEGSAGWGLVVSALTHAGEPPPGVYIGACCGGVDDIWQFAASEAGPADAYAAETVGLLWAAVAAFQLQPPCDIGFLCDNMAALGGACGRNACSDHAVWRACRGLHLALHLQSSRPIPYTHVRGHEGNPANELADAMADRGRRGYGVSPFTINVSAWFADQGQAFRWLPHVAWARVHPERAPPLVDGVMTWPATESAPTIDGQKLLAPFVRTAVPRGPKQAHPRSAILCTFLTYNALSIADPAGAKDGAGDGMHGRTGRVTLLDRSLHQHRVFIAGIQEARTAAGEFRTLHYHRYSSGFLAHGIFGIEIWIASCPPWPPHQAAVLFSTPTYLALKLSFGNTHLCVLAGHGPHRGHTEAVKDAWWRELADQCAKFRDLAPWVFLLDVNGRMGSVVTAAVGDHEADPEDCAGAHFRELLGRHQAWCPATFRDFAIGPAGTLKQKRADQWDRCDFVAIPQQWRTSTRASEVLPGINAGHVTVDHCAVGVTVSLAFQVESTHVLLQTLLTGNRLALYFARSQPSPGIRMSMSTLPLL